MLTLKQSESRLRAEWDDTFCGRPVLLEAVIVSWGWSDSLLSSALALVYVRCVTMGSACLLILLPRLVFSVGSPHYVEDTPSGPYCLSNGDHSSRQAFPKNQRKLNKNYLELRCVLRMALSESFWHIKHSF